MHDEASMGKITGTRTETEKRTEEVIISKIKCTAIAFVPSYSTDIQFGGYRAMPPAAVFFPTNSDQSAHCEHLEQKSKCRRHAGFLACYFSSITV